MKQIRLIVLVFVLMVSLTGCNNEKAGNEKNGETSVNEASEERDPAEVITFPAYEEANPEKLPFIDKVNNTPAFHVKVNLPENWVVENRKPDVENLVPGDFYSMLSIYEKDTLIGYIGFNIFDPYEDSIPEEQYYQTVYPGLRLSSVFHWDPYEAVKTTDTAETGIVDIWYLEPGEIDKHPGAMADVPQQETIGILSYDKELKVFIGMAFMPGTVSREQAETVAQSISLSADTGTAADTGTKSTLHPA